MNKKIYEKRILINIGEELKNKLVEKSKLENKGYSQKIRELIEEYVK